jgi:hypothetical protein
MKTKVSRHKRRLRPHNSWSKLQSDQGLQKSEVRKGGVPAVKAKRKDDTSQSKPRKIGSERRAKQKLNGAKTNGSVAKKIRAAEPKWTLELLERNGQAATEQPITATAVNEKPDPFDRRFNQIWLDWSYAMIPAPLMTTNDLIRRKTPIDLMAIGSRLALSSWLDVWLQVLEGQRDRRTKPSMT